MAGKRIHELAKEFGMSSKEMLGKITALGIPAKSHATSLSNRDVTRVREALNKSIATNSKGEVTNQRPLAYEGHERYVFVSYSHKDSSVVLPIIQSLQKKGFRIWYDPGIEPGAEWPEYIAEHINACSVFLTFMSGNASTSTNCRQEMHYAIHMQKDILVAYLDQSKLSPGMEMRLGPLQAVKRWKYDSDEAFAAAFATAKLLWSCKD